VKAIVGSRSEISLIPYDEVFPRDFEDMQRRVPSTMKLRKLIGFAPAMNLDSILEDIVAHQRASGTICERASGTICERTTSASVYAGGL
jgi:hypothetical protein